MRAGLSQADVSQSRDFAISGFSKLLKISIIFAKMEISNSLAIFFENIQYFQRFLQNKGVDLGMSAEFEAERGLFPARKFPPAEVSLGGIKETRD